MSNGKSSTIRGRRALMLILAGALIAIGLLSGAGCASMAGDSNPAGDVGPSGQTDTQQESLAPRVASLKGPTSIGLASLMENNEKDYEFTVCGTADEIAPQLLQGTIDIGLIPANLAATLYQKTGGAVRVIDINTLGVLYAVSSNTSIASVDDFVDKTIYLTGKGTVPEYTLLALLAASGVDAHEVSLEFRSEPAEVVALVSADQTAIGILPQPYATAAVAGNANLSTVLDLTEAWETTTGGKRGSLVTGVTVARAELIDEHPEAIERFLADHAMSVDAVSSDPEAVAKAVVDLGIIGDAALAQKALPACHTVCLTGSDMKDTLSGYLEALYGQDPAAIGGTLPDEGFYYLGS